MNFDPHYLNQKQYVWQWKRYPEGMIHCWHWLFPNYVYSLGAAIDRFVLEKFK